MGRAPCCDKVGLKKGPWTIEEDQKLTAYIKEHGHGSWRALPKKAGLLRCGKSCRLRWTNYLRPDIKRGEFSSSEEQTIIQLHALLGNRWSAIASHLPKRTDNEIKNYWNTHLKKRLVKMGLDPVTHKPQAPIISTSTNSQLEPANVTSGISPVTHMAQWESVRLEAEARLAREAEMRAKGMWPSTTSLSRPSSQESKLDSCGSSGPSLLVSLKQSCGGMMTSTKQEAGSCNDVNILDHMEMHSSVDLMPLSRSPSAWMMSLKEQMGSPHHALMKTTELINSLHNWENSLQGQAGMMWPDSWKAFSYSLGSNSNSGEGQESSSCSSASHGTNHGSPTSTLCSVDRLSETYSPANVTSTQAKKLCWSNILNIPNSPNQSMKPPLFSPLYDGLQGAGSKGSDCGGSSLLGVASLQELMQCEGLNDRSEGSLLICSSSNDFLGDLEMVSEDISSTHQSASADVSGNGGDIHQISYSALLGEEYTECEWNSVLEEDAGEAPSSQEIIAESKAGLPL